MARNGMTRRADVAVPGIPINQKLGNVQNVGAGLTAIAGVPRGVTYSSLNLVYREGASPAPATKATMQAAITGVRLLIDGEEFLNASAAEIIAVQDYYEIDYSDGVLPLIFERPKLITAIGRDVFMLGTADVRNIAIEIDVAAGRVNPSLELYGEYFPDPSNSVMLDDFIQLRRLELAGPSGNGFYDVDNLPRGPFLMPAMHLSSANFDDIEVLVNNQHIVKSSRLMQHALVQRHDRTPQAGYTHIDFAYRDRVADALNINVGDFRLRVNMTTAAPFTVLSELIRNRARGA